MFPGKLMLPNPDDAPAGAAQGAVHQPIAGFVPRQFLVPEGGVVPRLGRVPGTAMPETAVPK